MVLLHCLKNSLGAHSCFSRRAPAPSEFLMQFLMRGPGEGKRLVPNSPPPHAPAYNFLKQTRALPENYRRILRFNSRRRLPRLQFTSLSCFNLCFARLISPCAERKTCDSRQTRAKQSFATPLVNYFPNRIRVSRRWEKIRLYIIRIAFIQRRLKTP